MGSNDWEATIGKRGAQVQGTAHRGVGELGAAHDLLLDQLPKCRTDSRRLLQLLLQLAQRRCGRDLPRRHTTLYHAVLELGVVAPFVHVSGAPLAAVVNITHRHHPHPRIHLLLCRATQTGLTADGWIQPVGHKVDRRIRQRLGHGDQARQAFAPCGADVLPNVGLSHKVHRSPIL